MAAPAEPAAAAEAAPAGEPPTIDAEPEEDDGEAVIHEARTHRRVRATGKGRELAAELGSSRPTWAEEIPGSLATVRRRH